MSAHKASLINAILLVALGAWSYTESTSQTAIIPVVFGVLLLLCNPGLKKENKIVSHIAVVLTVLIVFGLIKPFMGAINAGNTLGIVRVGLMLLSSVFAIRYFVKSFIDARKA